MIGLRGIARFGLVCSSIVLAIACPEVRAQGTYTAASDAESDVNAVINGPTHTAVNGDVIQIPCSGTQSVVWSSQLVVTASITITALGGTPNSGSSAFGSGTNCLTIRDDYTGSGPLFDLTPTYASSNNVTTVQNMNIDPFSSSTQLYGPFYIIGTATASGFPQARLDNIVFGNAVQWTESGNGNFASWMIVQDDVIGVADHCTLPSGSAVDFMTGNFSSWLGVGQYGDESWAVADSMGGANNWFNENNVAYITEVFNDCETSDTFADKGGCRVVNRYNHVFCIDCFQLTGVHGLDTSGRPRSGRHTETYGNTLSCTTGTCQALTGFRGGTGISFSNTATGNTFNSVFNFNVYRNVYNSSPWGYCGGLNAQDPWDTNDNTVYYSGTITTASSLVMTDPSKSWTINELMPTGAPYTVYDTTRGFMAEIASNTGDTITVTAPIPESTWTGFANGDSYEIIRATVCADQGGRGQGNYISGATPPSGALNEAIDPVYEWGDSVPHFKYVTTQSARIIANRDYYTDSGAGQQATSSFPFNGTSGVGWGTVANRPATCTVRVGYFATDTNTLYECLTTNTWTSSYTPYRYPHPLTTGSISGNGVGPNPPTDLTATVQ